MNSKTYDVAVIGCGSIGLATAYYLARHHGVSRIALIDCGQPMAYSSAFTLTYALEHNFIFVVLGAPMIGKFVGRYGSYDKHCVMIIGNSQ